MELEMCELEQVSNEISIKITNSESGIVSLSIIDYTGKAIIEKFISNKIDLKVHSYPGGIYYVEINTDTFSEARKIVIK